MLRGREKGDLYEVCVALAAEMTAQLKKISPDEAKALVVDAINSGKAFEKMVEWVSAQGGDKAYIECPSLFPAASIAEKVLSPTDGFIASMNAEEIGSASALLGAGRLTKEDPIDYSAGIIIEKKTGDYVKKGDLLCTLYTGDRRRLADAEKRYLGALSFSDQKPEEKPLIYKIIR